VTARLDHLVLAAASLDDGVRWCQAALGITPGAGGRHALMGTHNRLFNISCEGFPKAFFEIIAIDPHAPAPARPRWFGLDRLDLSAGPRLLHWVARSDDLDADGAALRSAGLAIGPAIEASRDSPQGRLRWRITVPDDGRLLADGALPTLMDWGGTPHPTLSMPACGVILRRVLLRGLPGAGWPALGVPAIEQASDAGPALTAWLDTPRGPVTLTSF
jgi:hypothetical protein